MSSTPISADDLLTLLAEVKPEYRITFLSGRPLGLLRATADLCGVGDADTLGRQAAINSIVDNF